MNPTQTQTIRHEKYSTYVKPRTMSPKFHSFRSMISLYQDILHLKIFSLTPMLKFQRKIIAYIPPLVSNGLIKFRPHLIKTGGEVAFEITSSI